MGPDGPFIKMKLLNFDGPRAHNLFNIMGFKEEVTFPRKSGRSRIFALRSTQDLRQSVFRTLNSN